MTETQPIPKRHAVALVLLALVVRGGVLAAWPAPFSDDPDGYRYLAKSLAADGVFGYEGVPTAYRPPLYPLLLAPCVALGVYGNAGVAVLHVLLGVATVWLVYRLGLSLGLGGYALLAGALVACDPILLFQSTQVMTETAAAFLAVLALIAFGRAQERPSALRATVAGGCVGLAVLCRATFLPWAALVALVLPMFAGARKDRARVLACFVAGAAVVLGPWAARNQVQFGRPIVATTHGGFTLLLGNNPSFYEYLRTGPWGTVWNADEFNRRWEAKAAGHTPADELRNERLAYAEARENIRREPATFLYSCAARVGRLWTPLPHQVDADEGAMKRCSRYLVGLWYLAVLPLAAIGAAAILRRAAASPTRNTEWLWAFLLAATFTAVHALYWSNARMRAPLMPVVALSAAVGAAWLANRRPRN